jgi:hypothetical protein
MLASTDGNRSCSHRTPQRPAAIAGPMQMNRRCATAGAPTAPKKRGVPAKSTAIPYCPIRPTTLCLPFAVLKRRNPTRPFRIDRARHRTARAGRTHDAVGACRQLAIEPNFGPKFLFEVIDAQICRFAHCAILSAAGRQLCTRDRCRALHLRHSALHKADVQVGQLPRRSDGRLSAARPI